MQPQRAMPWMARFAAVAMAAIVVGISLSEAGASFPAPSGPCGPARPVSHAGSAVPLMHLQDPTDPAHA
jgi:hypothetical protein